MRVKISHKKVIDKIILPDANIINRQMLADRLGVSKSMAHYGITTGDWPEKYLPALRAIPLIEVVGRKRNK